MYDTAEEFNQKLSGCVVLLGGVPVTIHDARGTKNKINIRYTNLRTGVEGEISAFDSGWDFRSLGSRLGYTNVDYGKGSYQEAIYLTRMAVRQSAATQGLSHRNVKVPILKGCPRLGIRETKVGWQQITSAKWLLDTLERKYPTFSEVTAEFSKNPELVSKAFNPKFAVNRPDVGPFFLEYRSKNIGYSDDFSRWKIAPEFEHLNETLEHINVRVA